MTAAADTAFLAELRTALDTFDTAAADDLCQTLIADLRGTDEVMAETRAAGILLELRRSRRLELLVEVADAMIQMGQDAPVVRRHYAQALLEQGLVAAATSTLLDVVAVTDGAGREGYEARGLLGRAYKQQFVSTHDNAPARKGQLLARAIDAYGSVYLESPENVWHAANLASLLMRAARDGIELSDHPSPQTTAVEIARQIISTIEARPAPRMVWDCATLFEANLVVGDIEKALEWLRRFLIDDEVGAFELTSMLRQLTEVWQLRPDHDPGILILPSISARLLQKQGGTLTIDARDTSAARHQSAAQLVGFEKMFGSDGMQTQRWFEDLLQRCRGVARVEDEYEDGIGSGFLIRGSALHPSLPEVVLLTNAHVLPDERSATQAQVSFRGLPTKPTVRISRLIWTSPPSALDATVVELAEIPEGAEVCPVAPWLPELGVEPPNRVYVIGHPLGAPGVKISIQDNHLLDYDDVFVQYRTPTEQGSSGSPVFDRKWNVIALHHAGSEQTRVLHGIGTHPANEGIRLDQIRDGIRHADP